MRRTKRPFRAGGTGLAVGGLLFLLALALSGCSDPEPIVAVPPTSTPNSLPPTVAPLATPYPEPEALQFPLAAPAHVGIERPTDKTCVECHTDPEALRMSSEEASGESGSLSEGEDWAGELPPMEAWEKVYLDQDAFFETMHGRYGCITCHGGRGDTKLKEAAHQGMVQAPSEAGVCGDCHAQEVTNEQSSLHTNLAGYRTVLSSRSSPSKATQLETMMENHCEPCHTATCGQCHVSRTARLGGGLVAGHLFKDTQAINLTCAGCHGSRIETEYKGHNGTVPGDVHWVQERMLCSDCHLEDEFHGMVEEFVHRYDGRPMPGCQSADCHPDVAEDDGIEQHGDSHLKNLSCQACHSTAYKNCYGCHVGVADGTPYYQVESPQMAFKIGRNSIQGRYRPWKYVPVRHVPVARDSFAYYGEDLLTNFDAQPTWKFATPHNIQRITPQTESCNSCHGNTEFFLMAEDVAPDELTANMRVIVEKVPTLVP
jgi:hypothetical protein